MKALLVGGHKRKNASWVTKVRDRFGIEVVTRWSTEGRKSPPGGDYEAILLMADTASHRLTDMARALAETRGIPIYTVSRSMTRTADALKAQGVEIDPQAEAEVERTEARRRRRWTDKECLAIDKMRAEGLNWPAIGEAMGVPWKKCEGAWRSRRKARPELFGLPSASETSNPEPTELEEWISQAEQYAQERDKAVADAVQLMSQLEEERAKRIARATEIGNAKVARDEAQRVAALAVEEVKALRAKLAQERTVAVRELDAARATVGDWKDEARHLAQRLAKYEDPDGNVLVPAPERNGFDVDAFRAGADAVKRAQEGDATMAALLQLAGLA